MVKPCQFIEVSGAPFERGVSYGSQAAERIRIGAGHYIAQLAAAKFGWDDIVAAVAQYLPVIEKFEPAYVEEMRGMAQGAGQPFEAIVLLNARTELLQLAKRRARGEQPLQPGDIVDAEPDGCTGVVATREATASGRLLHGLNWDWKAECAETAVVLKVRREDGPDLMTFCEAGQLARVGLNAAGIAITANYLESDRDYRQVGLPVAFVRRKVLEQQRLALAMHCIYTTPKSASVNNILSHVHGIAIDFECAPDETFLLHPSDGLIVHANHWQSPVALSKLKEAGVANMPDSLYRDLRVRSLLEPQARAGQVTLDSMKAALFDDFETPWAVCRPPRQSLTTNLSATVAMVVMEPALGVMEVAMLPALNKEFSRFTLDMQIQPESSAPAPAAIG
ncbi:acyl-CoA--6-aminopenicillanic acid acyltransferase [Xylophilus rhododendri]|uniref:Acyl-CoA--6-aminopenicillanic acid acyltransferase n=1 Tax=Xylophilus rhododendri TaxID=2697032 RepID=A0A857J7D1_9BURK|nr:C45 family peptidase [Xylophilus rhododendri]QHI98961.1 acyl-CoA--6-aminopenicillanic acid acyltransferase [Xylophilus rhododendri]